MYRRRGRIPALDRIGVVLQCSIGILVLILMAVHRLGRNPPTPSISGFRPPARNQRQHTYRRGGQIPALPRIGVVLQCSIEAVLTRASAAAAGSRMGAHEGPVEAAHAPFSCCGAWRRLEMTRKLCASAAFITIVISITPLFASSKQHRAHVNRPVWVPAGDNLLEESSFAPPRMVEVRPGVWISSYDCITDEGYGRWLPCSAASGRR